MLTVCLNKYLIKLSILLQLQGCCADCCQKNNMSDIKIICTYLI